jgi:hypothetical protein
MSPTKLKVIAEIESYLLKQQKFMASSILLHLTTLGISGLFYLHIESNKVYGDIKYSKMVI